MSRTGWKQRGGLVRTGVTFKINLATSEKGKSFSADSNVRKVISNWCIYYSGRLIRRSHIARSERVHEKLRRLRRYVAAQFPDISFADNPSAFDDDKFSSCPPGFKMELLLRRNTRNFILPAFFSRPELRVVANSISRHDLSDRAYGELNGNLKYFQLIIFGTVQCSPEPWNELRSFQRSLIYSWMLIWTTETRFAASTFWNVVVGVYGANAPMRNA